MRFVPLIALIGMDAATNPGDVVPPPANPSVQPTVLPPDQPATLEACLEQALLVMDQVSLSNDPFFSKGYMGSCAVRFTAAEREAFAARIQPNDPATPVRVGNIVRNGLAAAAFLERESAQAARMPEALKSVLSYWRLDKVNFRKREYGGNSSAQNAVEPFRLFPKVTTVVDLVEGFGFSRKNTGECIVATPTDLSSAIAWANAFHAIVRHYNIRGQIVVSEDVMTMLIKGFRPLTATRQKKGVRTTWYLVEL